MSVRVVNYRIIHTHGHVVATTSDICILNLHAIYKRRQT